LSNKIDVLDPEGQSQKEEYPGFEAEPEMAGEIGGSERLGVGSE